MHKIHRLTWAHVLGALMFLAVLSGHAQAANPAVFPGGECTLVDQANGARIDKCKNLTDQTVNDIHLVFSHPGLPNVTIDYGQSLLCTTLGLGNCFGPAVAPGASWEGIAGGTGDVANVTIWGAGALADIDPSKTFSLNTVTVTGNWTKDGVAVSPVPEPSTAILLIAGIAGLLTFAKRRGGFSV